MGTRAGEKYLYFRTGADEDADDGSDNSALYPVSSFKGMHPTSDTAITMLFEPQIRVRGEGANATGNWTNNDSVVLNVTAGKITEVMKTIVQAINGYTHSDGFLVVADDSTIEVGGAAGSKQAVYLSPHITTCGAIAIGAAFAD